ncbi:hypothetical protein OG21DRAFT_1491530 [Imleria badia]|nr:hypothetical protein OG21DRAFT_1491530 [Imleria badia]
MAYYQKEEFNSAIRAWLVIWELKVVVELPAGVPMLYPSALFYHFNADISDFDLVAAENQPDVSKRGEYPDWNDDAAGRGSLVWFNQASMIQSAELGQLSIDAAKKKGMQTSTDFQADAHRYFSPAAPLASLLHAN